MTSLSQGDPLGLLTGRQETAPHLTGIDWIRACFLICLNNIIAPLRRALIYGAVSYGGLVLINNSELNRPNMWIAYLPMFVGVYMLTQ